MKIVRVKQADQKKNYQNKKQVFHAMVKIILLYTRMRKKMEIKWIL